jgi:hypothetical protein
VKFVERVQRYLLLLEWRPEEATGEQETRVELMPAESVETGLTMT